MNISARPVLLTSPFASHHRYGLTTIEVNVPLYVWTELLTHKRLSRNATSNRAMPNGRNVAMGYYQPPVFYAKGSGMAIGDPLLANTQDIAQTIYREVWEFCAAKSKELDTMGVCKEQSSRVLPTTKMIKGYVTGTVAAWQAVFSLRKHPSADCAMQLLMDQVEPIIEQGQYAVGLTHCPLHPNWKIAAAMLARGSYGKFESLSNQADLDLTNRLLTNHHLSPFEHIARFVKNPRHSAICSIEVEDTCQSWGWENKRAELGY